jgi:hypothetical protein
MPVLGPDPDEESHRAHWQDYIDNSFILIFDDFRVDPDDPLGKRHLIERARPIDFPAGQPENLPPGVSAEMWHNDGPGGGNVKLFTTVCHELMRNMLTRFKLAQDDLKVESHRTFYVDGVRLSFSSNHKSMTGLPGMLPTVRNACATELPENYIYQLFGDFAYPRAFCSGCTDPAATASMALSLNTWPHGEWYIMRCASTLHLWHLKGNAREGAEDPTIFGEL